MNRPIQFVLLLLVSVTLKLGAQGTAFNYQGRLNDAGAPANASYDLRFAVYDAITNGNQISVPLTNSAVGVTNGLFAVTLDFGAGVFTGPNYWLSVGVRTNGDTNAFTLLWPRQPVLPVPYAIFATSASNLTGTLAANRLTGTVPSAQISGAYGGQVNFSNGGNNFSGAFAGDGSSLSNLNGSQVTSGTVADTRLSGNVALLNGSQTFSGSNQFNGANTFTNWNNSFTGNFFGNGLVGWTNISGTTLQAERDHGYMLTSAGFTTVTLPPNSGLTNGDIVRVSGAGGGGWQVKTNAGQSILGNFASYRNGTLNSVSFSGMAGGLNSIAASGDGVRMYAVGGGTGEAYGFQGIFASSDSGRDWSQIAATTIPGYCSAVTCSANGKVVYVELDNGAVEKSTDSGATWASDGSGTANNFISCTADGSSVFTGNIACSGDGTHRAKLASGVISVSTNSGANYAVAVTAPASGVTCLAASSDCTRLVAGVSGGLLYASSNLGSSWTTLTATSQNWSGVWMSADGSSIVASVGSTATITGGIKCFNVSALPNTSTTNSITGSQGSAVELQYLGNGQFMPVSSTGLIWAN